MRSPHGRYRGRFHRSRTRACRPHARRRSATYSSPAAGRPSLVGVSHTGPTLSWSASPAATAASSCAAECVESPSSTSSPAISRAARQGHVVLAQMHAVGATGLGQVGPVVEPEQRPVLVAHAPEDAHAASISSASEADLSRSCTMSTPPPSAAASNSSSPGCTSVTKYSRARRSRSRRDVIRSQGLKAEPRSVLRTVRCTPDAACSCS